MASSSSPAMYTSQDEDTFVDDTPFVHVDEDDNIEEEEPRQTGSKRKRTAKAIPAETQPKKRAGEKRAPCWKHFDEVTVVEDDGFERACGKCKYCGIVIKADSTLNGTSGLKRHASLCSKNPDVIARKKQHNLVFKNNANGESSVTVWRHDENEIKKALLDFFVCAEIPFKLVEHWAFVRLINACNGKVKLPSRHKLSKDIVKYYLDERQNLYCYLSNPNNTISLTTDTWTSSCQRVNYMVLTGHFIDDDWIMHKKIINFRPIDSHKGNDIGSELMECIRSWGIKNVMTMTVDNAKTNDTAITYVLSKLENKYEDGKHFHIRCMAHIINLIVKEGLSHENYHFECIQKAVRYIRHSTQRIKKFKDCMKEEMVESEKFLCGDCPTRWNSTYEMLKRVVELKDIFFRYEGVDNSYERDLDRVPGHEDFGAAREMVQFLEKFKDKTVAISASTKPIAHTFFGEILDIDDHLRKWESMAGFCLLAKSMKQKYDRYWGKLDKLNDFMYFAVLLDPTLKKVFIRHCFRSIVINTMNKDKPLGKVEIDKRVSAMLVELENRMDKLFKVYEERFSKTGDNPGSQETTNQQDVVMGQGNGFVSRFRLEEDSLDFDSETELQRYLKEPKLNWTPSYDILKWWKQNEGRFPIVARMARDILAIQISTVASESAFSTGGRVLDPYRTRLSPQIVEALICTQDWVKRSTKPIFEDEVMDILNDDDIAMEMEEALNKQNKKGKEKLTLKLRCICD